MQAVITIRDEIGTYQHTILLPISFLDGYAYYTDIAGNDYKTDINNIIEIDNK